MSEGRNLHLCTLDKRTSDTLGKSKSPKPIPPIITLRVMFPTRLKKITRSNKAIIPKRSRDSSHILLPRVFDDQIINLMRQIRKTAVVDNITKSIRSQKTRRTILFLNRNLIKKIRNRIELRWEFGKRERKGKIACACCDGEWIFAFWEFRGVLAEVGEEGVCSCHFVVDVDGLKEQRNGGRRFCYID